MISKKLISIFQEEFKIDAVLRKKLLNNKVDIRLNTFQNWDSMKHVKLLIKIEKRFKIKINSKNENFFHSFKTSVKYLSKNFD
tara:strand:+ start:500 stop:748 length:249 start_codon:yes stop_codon:yes gene_type:complete